MEAPNRIESLQAELSQLLKQNAEIDRLRSKFDLLVEAHAQSKVLRQKHAADLKADLAEQRKRNKALEGQIAESKQTHRRQQAEAAHVLRRVQRLCAREQVLSKLALDQKDQERLALEYQVNRLQRKCTDREASMTELLDTITDLEDERDFFRDQAAELECQLGCLTQEAHEDRLQAAQYRHALTKELTMAHSDLVAARKEAKADRRSLRLQADLANQLGQLSSLSDLIKMEGLSSEVSTFSALYSATKKDLASLQTQHKDLQADRKAEASARGVAERKVDELQKETGSLSSKVQAEMDGRAEDLKLMQEEVDKLSDHLESAVTQAKEAEAQRVKLVGLLTQSRAAEAHLSQEVERLEEQLIDHQGLQHAHAQLSLKVSELAARNDLAEEDAARLSSMNASLIGHNNPQQRILQVQKIRAELAETKKKHAVALAALDAVKAENAELNAELDALKSVDDITMGHKRPVRRTEVLMDTSNQLRNSSMGKKASIGKGKMASVAALRTMAAN